MTTMGPAIRDELLQELMSKVSSPEELLGKDGLLKQLTARLVEKAMQAEMTDHLGYEPNERRPAGSTNSRNGTSQKTVQTDTGPVNIQVPRDREGTFERNRTATAKDPTQFSLRTRSVRDRFTP